MISVIVVPETEDFEFTISRDNEVCINEHLGNPKLKERNARYLIPFWLKECYADRIYHIVDYNFDSDKRYIKLGNSFLLPKKWTEICQPRRFEYHELEEFEMTEICSGLLVKKNQQIKLKIKIK
ncbi:MAG: hypothetical protein LBV20_00675 [Treponema sp.]|jgi:hypothetical protein|nr:hypothetical protein [Treponema sp.]